MEHLSVDHKDEKEYPFLSLKESQWKQTIWSEFPNGGKAPVDKH